VFKINGRALLALAPVLAAAAFALAPAAASAAECRVLTSAAETGAKAPCNNPSGVLAPQNLRANTDTPEGYGTDALAVNTHQAIRYRFEIGGVFFNQVIPTGDLMFGVKLQSNPESSTTECRAATGTIPWVDIQNAKPTAVFDGSAAWTFSINSNRCSSKPGEVIISNVSLLFETLGTGKSAITAAGTILGKYSQPSAEKCPAGGIELVIVQRGITTKPATEEFQLDNDDGGIAYVCFVSANNYLFPETAPKWEKFTDINGIKGAGIWGN
jgi:hypothetical protein